MKRFFSFFAIAAMMVAFVGCSDNDTPTPIEPPMPEPPTPAKEATLSLECLEVGIHDVTIKIVSENAVDVRYIAQRVGNGDTPTAEQVIQSGTKVECGECVVKIENLYALTTHDIYVAAANIENKLTFATLQVTTEFYPDPNTDKENLDVAKEHFEQMISQYGNYDASAVAAMLQGKIFEIWAEVKYNDDWSEVELIQLFCAIPEITPRAGWEPGEFEFTEDNGVKYNSSGYFINDYPAPVEYTRGGKWVLDPQSKQLTFNFDTLTTANENIDTEKYRQCSISCILVAINNEMFIIDWPDGYNKRGEYMVKE